VGGEEFEDGRWDSCRGWRPLRQAVVVGKALIGTILLIWLIMLAIIGPGFTIPWLSGFVFCLSASPAISSSRKLLFFVAVGAGVLALHYGVSSPRSFS
jgi:hypothetical protein